MNILTLELRSISLKCSPTWSCDSMTRFKTLYSRWIIFKPTDRIYVSLSKSVIWYHSDKNLETVYNRFRHLKMLKDDQWHGSTLFFAQTCALTQMMAKIDIYPLINLLNWFSVIRPNLIDFPGLSPICPLRCKRTYDTRRGDYCHIDR